GETQAGQPHAPFTDRLTHGWTAFCDTYRMYVIDQSRASRSDAPRPAPRRAQAVRAPRVWGDLAGRPGGGGRPHQGSALPPLRRRPDRRRDARGPLARARRPPARGGDEPVGAARLAAVGLMPVGQAPGEAIGRRQPEARRGTGTHPTKVARCARTIGFLASG